MDIAASITMGTKTSTGATVLARMIQVSIATGATVPARMIQVSIAAGDITPAGMISAVISDRAITRVPQQENVSEDKRELSDVTDRLFTEDILDDITA